MSSQRTTIERPKATKATPRSVLLVEDDGAVAQLFGKILESARYDVVHATDGRDARRLLEKQSFDAVVTDISMPRLNGIELLKLAHARDKDLPVVLVTGNPQTSTAIEAVHFGALRYLVKPVDPLELQQAVAEAIETHEASKLKTAALPFLTEKRREAAGRAELEARFTRALEQLYMVYQPIVCPSTNRTIGYEALVRTEEASFHNPGELLTAAEELGVIITLGRKVRSTVADDIPRLSPDASVFVNLHPFELLDDELYSSTAPIACHAKRVVYEITERACLDTVESVPERLARLRALGCRVAVDDLGSGYSGLTSFVNIAPEFIKLDMELIRDVDRHVWKREIIRSLVAACATLDIELICEGVETAGEANTLTSLGAHTFQGYLFSPPKRIFEWTPDALLSSTPTLPHSDATAPGVPADACSN